MADSLMVEEAALQAQLECVEENENEESNNDTIALGDDKNDDAGADEGKKSTKRKLKKRKRHSGPRGKDGVLYIGHLGNDFLEPELAKFLAQFGKVKALRLSRSKRTGGSKGYAFCQMETQDIANIVADTLSGYILFGKRRLVCHVVPPEKVHDGLFFKFVYKPLPPPQQTKSKSKIKAVTEKLVARERRKREALKELGIDYDFPGFDAELSKTPTKEVDEVEEPRVKKARKVSDLDVTSHTKEDKEDEGFETPTKSIADAAVDEETEQATKSTESKKSKKSSSKKKKKKKKKASKSSTP